MSRIRHMLAAVLAGLLMVAGISAASAPNASAHTPKVTASCTPSGGSKLTVDLSAYNNSGKNHVKVVADGDVKVDKDFGASYTGSWSWSGTADISYTVTVSAWDDPSGKNGWSFTKSGTINSCVKEKVPVPAAPETKDPCNPSGVKDNVAWKNALPDSTSTTKWAQSADGRTRTASLIGDREWTDGTRAPKSWSLPKDSGEVCITKIEIPAELKQLDKCNAPGVTDNVTWAYPLPASTDDVLWTESADGRTRTASLKDTTYTKWTDETTAPKEFNLKKDSGEVCPLDASAGIKVTDPSCTAKGSAVVAGVANAELVGTLDQSVGTHEAVFEAIVDHFFPGGKVTKVVSYTIKAQLTGEQCGSFEDDGDGPRHEAPVWPLVAFGVLAAASAAGAVIVVRRRKVSQG